MEAATKPAFMAIIEEHGENMLILAHTLLGNSERANDVVQQLLLRLKEIDFDKIILPVDQFLYVETKKACET